MRAAMIFSPSVKNCALDKSPSFPRDVAFILARFGICYKVGEGNPLYLLSNHIGVVASFDLERTEVRPQID